MSRSSSSTPEGADVVRRRPDARVAATACAPTTASAPAPAPASALVGTPANAAPVAAPDLAAPDLAALTAGDLLTAYLNGQASAFLRALRQHTTEDAPPGRGVPPYGVLLRTTRRISGALSTYRPLTDAEWADRFCGELGWLAEALAREHEYAARLDRLLAALHRLSGGLPGDAALPAVGAARAAALLERQLTLARTRGHSAALQALGSSRFHALADGVALLASEVPLEAAAFTPAERGLLPLADEAHRRLTDAVDALPLGLAAKAYNGEALHSALFPPEPAPEADPAPDPDPDPDARWQGVLALARLSRYAFEVCGDPREPLAVRLGQASSVLRRHEEAVRAADAAAAAGRTPRIAPATAYALGVLHADQRRDMEAARYLFSRLWHHPAPAVPSPPVP